MRNAIVKGGLRLLTMSLLLSFNSSFAQPVDKPKLVVVISVDQMRQDFYDRFGEHFTGGLKRIWDEGVVYTNAHHVHGPTNTAPGHAALATGKYPSKHGIINNSLYDRGLHQDRYCVGDESVEIIGVDNNGALPARSPRNLKSTTIGDWVKKKSSNSKVYSVSKKDRSAVLMGGQRPDGAFWLDNLATKFVTSTYYYKEYPEWANRFDPRAEMADVLEKGWYKKMPDQVYADLRPDEFEVEAGAFLSDYPHTRERMRQGIPDVTKDVVLMTVTPMGDRLILDFAKHVVESTDLGNGEDVDFLMVGLSAADGVGHHFGPESHEVMDHFLYLDEYIGSFMEYLDSKVGADNYWLVLSSDHGAAAVPEALQMRGLDAERVLRTTISDHMDSIELKIQAQFGLEAIVIEDLSGGVYVNYIESDAKGIKRSVLRKALAEEINSLYYVADTYTSDMLQSKDTGKYLDIYKRSFHSTLSPDIAIRLKENYIVHGKYGTVHGSVYDYDTSVPLIFRVPGINHQVVDRKVATVDLAPSLAVMLGVKADRKVDGISLPEVSGDK